MLEHQQTQHSKNQEPSSQRRSILTNQTHVLNPAAILQRARVDPKSLTSADVLQLQRTVGNRAVGRLLSEIRSSSIAQQTPVQRQEIPEEEEPLQRKRENNTGMPDSLKTGVERLSGIDMSDVRVHYNSSKPAEVRALAYTQGTNIHVVPGQEKYLPHEKRQSIDHLKCITLLKGNESNFIAPVQRKIGDEGNVIFGLNGKNAEAIKNAVDSEYTTFDAADSYGNIISLKEAIQIAKSKGKSRNNFEIIYKVDVTEPDKLESHLTEIANMFDNYIDYVLIHKVTDRDRASKYSLYLQKLKGNGLIKNVGSGDAKAKIFDQLQEKDSFEIDAYDLFLDSDAELLINELNNSGKPVFVYNIIGTLKKILNLGMDETLQQSQISAMVQMIKIKVKKAEPILSSMDAEKAKKNLEIYEPEDWSIADNTYKSIEKSIDDKKPSVPIAKMESGVKNRISDILYEGYDWAAADLSKEGKKFERGDYEEVLKEKLKLFIEKELGVRYEGTSEGHTKKYTLKELLYMLFDARGNCHRVEASNFLSSVLYD